jgi:hypothetical protein
MKAEIVVTFEGIQPHELKDALQGLRNVEQEDPERITMFAMVTAPELSTDEVVSLLKSLNPPLPYMKVLTKNSTLTSNREIHEAEPQHDKEKA